VDRSHRKLAHRGSYTGQVFVSPSTLLRAALRHRVELPGEPFRVAPPRPALPEVPWWGQASSASARRPARA
jgi:putative transposase